MQRSTDARQMKAALWDQAFIGGAYVSCPMGRVVAKRREEGAAPGDDMWVGGAGTLLRICSLKRRSPDASSSRNTRTRICITRAVTSRRVNRANPPSPLMRGGQA